MTSFDYDLFVIGAGSGGIRASRISHHLGAKVAIAELAASRQPAVIALHSEEALVAMPLAPNPARAGTDDEKVVVETGHGLFWHIIPPIQTHAKGAPNVRPVGRSSHQARNVESFIAKAVENSADSRKEPGCRQFDVLVDPTDRTQVMLYEVYVDEKAFDAHQQTAHFKKYIAEAVPLLASRRPPRVGARRALGGIRHDGRKIYG